MPPRAGSPKPRGRPKTTLVIQGGTVVTAAGTEKADVLVEDGKIAAIGKVKAKAGATKIKATGCYVIPGGVDPHVHMELPLPQTVSSDDFVTGTAAALHGGTTTILDFANQVRGHSLAEALTLWHEKAQGRALCDYGFHVSVTDYTPQAKKEVARFIKEEGISSFKTFLAYKSSLMIDDEALGRLMNQVQELGGLVTVHAEDGEEIERLVARHLSEGETGPTFHARSRPADGEARAARRVLALAQTKHCPIYLVHLSTAGAVAALREARARGQRAHGETCIQYLLLDESVYDLPGFEAAKYVLSPPLRARSDQEALWKALADRTIEVVATDHCPFRLEQRELGRTNFSRIPNGLGGVEHRVELLYSEGVKKNRLSLERWVDCCATAPAEIFGLAPRKGIIAPGADADLVVFDPKARHTISSKRHHMNVDYSVYEGRKVQGKCRTILLRGRIAAQEGEICLEPGAGIFLPRPVK